MIIDLSDLFGITIDEMLRIDEELKEKVIRDSKKLAHPKWKAFFYSNVRLIADVEFRFNQRKKSIQRNC